jgi:hypothetical protein
MRPANIAASASPSCELEHLQWVVRAEAVRIWRIHAELASNDLLHVEVDIFVVDFVKRRLIAAKLIQAICVLKVHWH